MKVHVRANNRSWDWLRRMRSLASHRTLDVLLAVETLKVLVLRLVFRTRSRERKHSVPAVAQFPTSKKRSIRHKDCLNVCLVAQNGRLGYQALLSAASIRAFHATNSVAISICIPNHTNNWEFNPRIADSELLKAYERYDCEVIYFDNRDFGSSYPHSNKFYSILSLPPRERFLFLDSDTLLVEPMQETNFNFARPGYRQANVIWPVEGKNSYTAGEIWRSLYAMLGVDSSKYLVPEREENSSDAYPYYNAALIYYSEANAFGATLLDIAKQVWNNPPPEVVGQPLNPWLDQIALPLTLAKLGICRRKSVDPIRRSIKHYHSPVYLMSRNTPTYRFFNELCADSRLVEVLRRDKAFGFYMSDEGKRVLETSVKEFMQSPENQDRRVLKEIVRGRAPRIR